MLIFRGPNNRMLAPATTAMRPFLPACLFAAALAASASAGGEFRAEALARIDRAVERAVEAKKLPGAVVVLERRGTTYARAYGRRCTDPEPEPMTADTIFDAASLTKVVATTPCVMKLVEDGRIGLDDPAARHLPELGGDPNKKAVTIRHLLIHCSGLPAGIRPGYEWSGYEHGVMLACCEPSNGRAGIDYLYSDINFILLGEIVQRVAGKRLDRFAAERIFGPLGMRDSGFLPGGELRPRIAPTTRMADGGVLRGLVHDPTARRMGGVAGHAGVFTTAADLARYARMMLNGGELDGARVLRPETVKLMTRVQTPDCVTARRGLGWDIDSPYAGPSGKHFPLGSFGHSGWTGTSLWIDPFSETAVIFLSNRNHPTESGSAIPLQRELGTLAAEAVDGFDFGHVRGALAELSDADRRRAEERRAKPAGPVRNGIDVLVARRFSDLRGLRVGLITNHTGIDRHGKPTIDLMAGSKHCKLVALFGPEHGIRGEGEGEQADGVDAKTGLKVHSLYNGIASRKPRLDQLAGLDALVFDMQDVGCRFFTYAATMGLAMQAAAEAGIRFVVLDRVNPIGGEIVAGPVVVGDPVFTSFHRVPVRHGMTIGELARLFRAEHCPALDLTVVPLENWRRPMFFDQTGLPWVRPSPNLPRLTGALLYPGVGLLEFTNLSVGRGTALPFELVGAPYIDPAPFAAELERAQLPGLRFVPVHFTPASSKFSGSPCGGVRILVTDREACPSVELGLVLAQALRKLHPADWENVNVNFLLCHPPTANAIIEELPRQQVMADWQAEVERFKVRRKEVLLY